MFFKSRKRTEERNLNLGNGANNIQLALVNGQLQPVQSGVNASEAVLNSDIYSVVNLIASDVASANFKINVPDSNLSYLLSRHPNDLFSPYTFWQTVLCNLCLNGNSFVLIWRDPVTLRATKLELLINMETNVLMTDDSQELIYQINFFDDRPQMKVSSKDMLHFRLMPTNITTQLMVMGVSPLMALADENQIEKQSNKLTLTSLMKSVNPSGILTLNKGLPGKSEKENIRRDFEEANTGTNAGRPMILDPLTSYKSVSIDPNVLELLKGTDWTRQQVCKAFGVPTDLLQMESEHSNIQQILVYYASCLSRYMNALTSEITDKLCDFPNETVTMDTSTITDPDNSAIENRMANLVKNGVITSDAALSILQQKGGW
ncbi:phage portal protein [Sporolactobacillus sp. CQH2019]|uniref:phage portal protein n=1 Tax=Sporolactobacillus sp. CQH2019 TaxID=3023512 RepID=UPI002368E9E7|nr:phage portal protein [Sporolactobacillus sp. CQH2019]MDD9149329.1 phage portal protein [Sporolactobacillus sp. CQH2019]